MAGYDSYDKNLPVFACFPHGFDEDAETWSPLSCALTTALGKIADLELQRDRWQHQALVYQANSQLAEAELEAQRREFISNLGAGRSARSVKNDNAGFMKLRALIIKQLHPDLCVGSATDKAARTEIFKALWPDMESIHADFKAQKSPALV